MLISFIKITAVIVIILSYFLTSGVSKSKDQDIEMVKRSLMQREKDYLKKSPMSEALRSFIEKFRNKRRKRSEGLDENLLYVIQDGELVPFKQSKNYKRSDEFDEKGSFTVVPLVIPLQAKLQDSKLIKIRDINGELQKDVSGPQTSVASTATTSASVVSSSAVALTSTGSITSASLASIPGITGAASTVSSNTTEIVKPGANQNGSREITSEEESNNSTQEETKVLHKILEDVEGLMQQKSDGNKKEGMLCNLSGSWISDAAGMRFDINYKPETRKKFRIHVADRIPPNEDGFLCDGNWSIFGEIPFQHSGVVIVLAVHEKDKHIAMFIGECRVCEGSETVTGTWLVGRSSRDCKDQKASHKVLSDVWKKERTHSLQKKHLMELGITVKDDD